MNGRPAIGDKEIGLPYFDSNGTPIPEDMQPVVRRLLQQLQPLAPNVTSLIPRLMEHEAAGTRPRPRRRRTSPLSFAMRRAASAHRPSGGAS